MPVPTPTSAATLSPPASTWEVGPVLVTFGTYREDPAPFGVSRTPELILYADGLLIVRTDTGFLAVQLSHKEVCALLAAIEATGFFDVDMTAYQAAVDELPMGLVSVTRIGVNTWRHRRVSAEALWEFMENDDADARVPDGLHDVYVLLDGYRPPGLRSYRYNRVALAIHQLPAAESGVKAMTWPLDSPKLFMLEARAEAGGVRSREKGFGLLLEGETADRVYEAIAGASSGQFAEGGATYVVAARPLLPYESLESAVGYTARIPSVGMNAGTVTMRCEWEE
jgi:hypothetical protein